jgi:Sulfotransferase family
MVDAHPQIAIIPEIRWLAPRFTSRAGLTPEGLVTPALLDQLSSLGDFTPFPLNREELAELVRSDRPLSYADFIAFLFDRYGQNKGKALVGHKNADPTVPPDIRTLHTLWPNAKFVHLIRDGRDVCLSVNGWRLAKNLKKAFSNWNEAPVSTAALWWEWQVSLGREAGIPLGPELYREFRYESMVAHPAETCAELCVFMGVPYDDTMTTFYEGGANQCAGRDVGRDPSRQWLPPTPGLRDWRSQMLSEDVERFEAVAGDLLDELAYSRGINHPCPELLENAVRMRAVFEGRPLPQRWHVAPGPNPRQAKVADACDERR